MSRSIHVSSRLTSKTPASVTKMKSILAFAAIALSAILGVTSPSDAAVIFRWSMGITGSAFMGSNPVTNPSVTVFFGYIPDGDPNFAYGTYNVFRNFQLRNANVGQTFVANSTSATQFDALFARLTDGVDGGRMRIGYSSTRDNGQAGAGWPYPDSRESYFFSGAPNVDLAGFDVIELRMRVDQLNVRMATGVNTMIHTGQVTFEIEVQQNPLFRLNGPGTTPTPIPEPASAVVLMTSAGWGILRRRRGQVTS